MSKIKVINDRCPLQGECGRKKCEHKFCERDCSYYQGNARPGAEIPDQEEAMEAEWEARMTNKSVLADTSAPAAPQDAEPVVVNGDAGALVLLPVDKLLPHPDNPRKDLGNLQELADSIKANGVLQNLTVVSLESEAAEWSALSKQYQEHPTEEVRNIMNRITTNQPTNGEGLFRVVIGHRRLAAAKLAGLAEVPCVISSMDYREQVRTMLMENIQRADLTVYEQAQGFQMMLDLGDSVEAVAEKSGFSQSTVRRRVKLLELDPKKFKKSESRGATLFDYMELDKVESPETKNKLLDVIGTPDFKNKLQRAIENEKHAKILTGHVAAISEFATSVTEKDQTKMRYVRSYGYWNDIAVERPDDADTVSYFFTADDYNVTLYRAVEPEDANAAAARAAEEARKRDEREKLKEGLKGATARAYNLRLDFVKGISATKAKRFLLDITAFIIWCGVDGFNEIAEEDFPLFGLNLGEDEEFTMDHAMAAAQSPEKAILRLAYVYSGDSEYTGYFDNYLLKYSENEQLDAIYTLLEKLGYEMSDEEKALQDGTHELFREGKPAAQEDKEAGQDE